MRQSYSSLPFDFEAPSRSLPRGASGLEPGLYGVPLSSSNSHHISFPNDRHQDEAYSRMIQGNRPFSTALPGAPHSSTAFNAPFSVHAHQHIMAPVLQGHGGHASHGHQQHHGHHGHGHQQHSQPLSKGALFVGDLSFFASEADLRRLFSPYGKLKRAEVKRGRFGDSLMHGFVELDQLAGAQLAMRELDGVKFMGRRVRVHWAYSNAEKSSPRDREQWTQLHVTFTTSRIDTLVSEEVLDRLFSRFGEVADVTVKKHARTIEPPFQSGYAFVYFYLPQPAVVASERLKSAQLGDVHFETALSFRSQRVVETLAAMQAAQRMGLGAASNPLGSDILSNSTSLGSGLEVAFSSLHVTGAAEDFSLSLSSSPSQQAQFAGAFASSVMSHREEEASVHSLTSQSTQPLPFDREALLQMQSQQTSDSSLSLYSSPSAAPSLLPSPPALDMEKPLKAPHVGAALPADEGNSIWEDSAEPATPTTAVVSSATYAILRD